MGKSLQHLSDFTFTQVANFTLVRRDSYLEHLKAGVKPDTFSALRNCPLNGYTLVPDAVIRKAEDDIAQHEAAKRTSQPGRAMGGSPAHTRGVRIDINPTPQGGKVRILQKPQAILARTCWLGNPLVVEADHAAGDAEDLLIAAPEAAKMLININDNYCVKTPVLEHRSVVEVPEILETVKAQTNVNYCVVIPVPFVTRNVRQPQKKGVSPPLKKQLEIKSVNCVSSVGQFVSAPSVPNVHSVVHAPLVGGCLQPFWQVWARLGANPKVVSILKEGYVLPFNLKPPLVRDPMIISGYADPLRNLYLRESVQNLLHKRAIEMVRVRTSLAFYNRLFIVPKPNQKWRPVLDLSALNKFLNVKTFKMETPETIRISLQQGEWVTSLDFSDAYFHIPVHTRFFQNLSYQFRSLPFGLSTAPM